MTAQEHGERLASIETELRFIREDLAEIKALSKRVSALERWRAWLLGVAATIGALVGLVLRK